MLEYNEITVRKYIIFENEPYEVLDAHVFRKQQRKPVNATKLRNLLTGRIVEHSFHVQDKAEEADIDTKKIKYLFHNKGEYWFCEESDQSKRFELDEALLGNGVKFLKQNSTVDATVFNDNIFGIKLPVKVELKVTEAFDAVRGDTSTGGSKQVTLETGAVINVPLFIKQGEVIKVNTDTGEYSERV
jgi:elongation factor P